MVQHWFISDTHFGHNNIIQYCNRPFFSVEEMNQTIIENINALVDTNDILWHLGDFAFGYTSNATACQAFRNQIRCRNINLVIGNHDKSYKSKYRKYKLFNTLGRYTFVGINQADFLLTHFPPQYKRYDSQIRFTKRCLQISPNLIHLYGHVHNNSSSPNNLCVENTDYRPLSFDQIIERVQLENP